MSVLCIPCTAADREEFVQRVERLVLGRAGNRIRDLHVEVRGDEVLLTGRANSYYAKQLATHAALCEIAPLVLNNSIAVV